MTLVERGEFTSGTTGRHHGLLHSGARYAVNDQESAIECIEENRILRTIAPGSFEENDGLFVAITDEDMEYLPGFLEGCDATGIPAQQLTPERGAPARADAEPGAEGGRAGARRDDGRDADAAAVLRDRERNGARS